MKEKGVIPNLYNSLSKADIFGIQKRGRRRMAIERLTKAHSLIELNDESKEIKNIIKRDGLRQFWEIINIIDNNLQNIFQNVNGKETFIPIRDVKRCEEIAGCISYLDLERFKQLAAGAKPGYDFFNKTFNKDSDTISMEDHEYYRKKLEALDVAIYPPGMIPGPMATWPPRQ